jgi:hypothetical protein
MEPKPIIIDSFCYFEPYQTNMLLVKFNVEDEGVDEWVITENTYSFRGDYKGPHQLKNILSDDKRFEKFLPKIKIFEMELERKCEPGVEDWEIIFLQREVQREYLYNKYSLNSWLLVSDIDEIIDFANPRKAGLIYDAIEQHSGEIIHPNPMFFAYDFDNTAPGGEWLLLALVELAYLNKHNLRLEQARMERSVGYCMPYGSTGYHYHSCMGPKYIWRKLNTYGHTDFLREDVNQWLYYNHGMFRSKHGEQLDPKRFTWNCVELTEENSPLYVRENIEWLETNSVHPDYQENRRKWISGRRDVPDIVGGKV